MPIDYSEYPPNWKTEIRPRILDRANNCCEFCGVENHSIIVRDGEQWEYCKDWYNVKKLNKGNFYLTSGGGRIRIVLTIAHLDHDEENHNVKDDRLAALCQRCHLRYDAKEKARRRKVKKYSNSLFPIN